MKKILLTSLLLAGIMGAYGQISTNTGGAGNVLANNPVTSNVGIGNLNPSGKLDK